jgi:hypothetical protein
LVGARGMKMVGKGPFNGAKKRKRSVFEVKFFIH